jgi:hypothetical protein
MAVQARRIAPALLVLLVLGTGQVAYGLESLRRQSPEAHCAGQAPPPAQEPCRLPLWLPCCDERVAVSAGAQLPDPSAALALPLATQLVPAAAGRAAPRAARVPLRADPPQRSFSVLLL